MLKVLVIAFSNLLERPMFLGTVIQNRFKVIRHLGSGSYGHSYLVYDDENHNKVVLKALRVHKRVSKKGRFAFQNEMNILKEINHPSFPKYLGSGIFSSTPFFIMEFIEGKTFEQLIFEDGKKFGETEAFKLGSELLEIIEYLHQHNIIHRDIRIPNIMWDGQKIKLIDLGLAKEITKNKKDKSQAIHHPRKQIDFKSDFYGLGHFLLFLLYSQYSPPKGQKEKSWEEELRLSPFGRRVIRKLLQIESPYETCKEIKQDFLKIKA